MKLLGCVCVWIIYNSMNVCELGFYATLSTVFITDSQSDRRPTVLADPLMFGPIVTSCSQIPMSCIAIKFPKTDWLTCVCVCLEKRLEHLKVDSRLGSFSCDKPHPLILLTHKINSLHSHFTLGGKWRRGGGRENEELGKNEVDRRHRTVLDKKRTSGTK